MKKKIIIVVVLLLFVFVGKFVISHRYLLDSSSPEYALYRIVTAGFAGDKDLMEAYTSEEFYKYALTECNQSITPETINVVKKVWLDTVGAEKCELNGIVKLKFDYAFSHIIQLKNIKNRGIKWGKNRIFVMVKPILANDVIEYSVLYSVDKPVQKTYTLKREMYNWKLIKFRDTSSNIDCKILCNIYSLTEILKE